MTEVVKIQGMRGLGESWWFVLAVLGMCCLKETAWIILASISCSKLHRHYANTKHLPLAFQNILS